MNGVQSFSARVLWTPLGGVYLLEGSTRERAPDACEHQADPFGDGWAELGASGEELLEASVVHGCRHARVLSTRRKRSPTNVELLPRTGPWIVPQ